jgi:hypothetical protein
MFSVLTCIIIITHCKFKGIISIKIHVTKNVYFETEKWLQRLDYF